MGEMSEPFPFTKPEGSEADMFIQWKGTKVCLDFHCDCGRHSHVDEAFTYFLRCRCGQVYEMGTQVIAKKVSTPEKSIIIDMKSDEWDIE